MAEITYFESERSNHTEQVLQLALTRFRAGGIDKIVIASTYGDTALKAVEVFAGTDACFIIVGEVLKEGKSPERNICDLLEEKGHKVIWGTHMGEMSTFTQDQSANLISNAFYRLGQGFKVTCEIVLMSTSQGYFNTGEKILSIAGTHRGADTAIVANAASFSDFQNFAVLEILCKPYQQKP
jgi:uncharacterized protein